MGLIWQSFRNWKRKHWFCHLQSFNGQPKLWFSDPKVVQLWAGKLELPLSSKIGWVGDSNGWDKLTHRHNPKPKQYDVKEGIIFRTDEKWTNSHTHISHQQHLPTSLIGYDYNPILGWESTHSLLVKLFNYLDPYPSVCLASSPVLVGQTVKPSNLVENTKTSPAEARQNPPGKKTRFA